MVAAELFGTSRTLRRDAELYCLFFDLLYDSAGRAIEHDIARRLRLLVSKFEIPAYLYDPAWWLLQFLGEQLLMRQFISAVHPPLGQ